METIRIALVEDHHLVRRAVVDQLRAEPDLRVPLELEHGGRLLESLGGAGIQLVLLDLGMDYGVFDPITTIQRLRARHPEIRIVVLSSQLHSDTALRVLQTDIQGYVLKSDLMSLDLAAVVRRVASGGRYFSPEIEDMQASLEESGSGLPLLDHEERDLLRLAAEGNTNRQIAYLLGYSEKTVRNRLTPIYRKLGASNRVEALRRARAMGLLSEGTG